MRNYKRHTVTAALPYANGPVHIGHLAGVYVPADIYSRYLRLKGKDVLFVCGSDEHGVPITLKARQEGISPQEVVDRYHSIIKDSFEKFGISTNIYSRTSSETHHKTSSDFFKKLYDDGLFEEKTTAQFYDIEASQFLADRYLSGTCPHCGNEKAYGDQCENCGTSLNGTDLINPVSTITGCKPVMKETKHWYLPLEKYEAFLKNWILVEHKEWKPNVYGQCKSWLDQGLQARAVSRDLNWGVPVPIDGADGKVLYVWFDAPIGYISNSIEWAEKNGKNWEDYWKSEDARLVHFIGKDNIVFHCIIFPTMLKAHGDYILPDNVPANEFLNLEGDKISTSRNWAVWLHEYLQEFPGQEDVLRYVLCANAPESKDNDFTWKDFQARNNNELVAILGNFINRALVLTQKYYNGIVPKRGELNDFDRSTLQQLKESKDKIEHQLDNFRFREALKEAMNLARLGNKYLADCEPWIIIKTNPERVHTVLNISLQITANLAIIFEPFLPFTSEKIWKFLSKEKAPWNKLGNDNLLKSGDCIGNPDLLFSKVEDQQIEFQVEKLLKTKAANAANNKQQAVKEPVSFEQFSELDIRTGTIIEAEKVPKTKKLLKLKIDTGIDQRTVVSGIAEYYSPDEIIGKQVTILLNLEPRLIKGIESQGMILMAENNDGELIFVEPSKKTNNGASVK